MGNCQPCDQINRKSKSVEWQFDVSDEVDVSVKKNVKDYKQHAPNSNYAQQITFRPILLESVSQTLNMQLMQQPLRFNQVKGVKMPIFYIPEKQGVYEGEWQSGLPHGKGKLYLKNGSYFEGNFLNGEAQGTDGILIYPDGSFKRGTIRKSKLEGYGIFWYKPSNLWYEGEWENDRPHGLGKETYSDGSSYEGGFKYGKKHGSHGVYLWDNQKKYQGPFVDGYMEGEGVMTMQKGEYRGHFEKNLKEGRGIMKTQKGIFSGVFRNGMMEGQGTFQWYDGKKYEGQFNKNQLHGRGIIIYPNGQKVQGEWVNGENIKLQTMQNEKVKKKKSNPHHSQSSLLQMEKLV